MDHAGANRGATTSADDTLISLAASLIAVLFCSARVLSLASRLCTKACACRESRLIGHVELHLGVGVKRGHKFRMQRLAAAD
jgi:hypothetical protein